MVKQDGAAVTMTLKDWLNTRVSCLRMAADGVIKNRRMPTKYELEVLTKHCLDEAAKTLDAAHPSLAPALFSQPQALVRCGSIP